MEKFEYEFIREYDRYISNLKKTSYDSKNDVYLCNDTSVINVFDFDSIVKDLYPQRQPKSFDCILCDDKDIFCIEFKNSFPPDIKNRDVECKLNNSQIIIDEFCKSKGINKLEYRFIYCVIFKPYHNPAKLNRLYKSSIAGNSIHFELEKYKGIFFDEIITKDKDFFIKNFSRLIKKQKLCC